MGRSKGTPNGVSFTSGPSLGLAGTLGWGRGTNLLASPNLPGVSLEAGACSPGEGEVLLEHKLLQAPPPRKELFPHFPASPTPADLLLFQKALPPPLQTAKLGAQGQNPTGT